LKGHINALQNWTVAVSKIDVADFYQGCGHYISQSRVEERRILNHAASTWKPSIT
jgi:hypothetical protein